MPKYSIYIIRNIINEKVYIGKSINPQLRKKQHFYRLKKGVHDNSHLQASFNEYGEAAFEFSILKYCNSEKEMNQSEIGEIQKARNSEDGCYNLLGGGEGGSHSEETKEKLRQTHLGKKYGPMSEEHKEKIRQANLGKKRKPFSEEHKEKMRQANLGKKQSEETKEKIRQAKLGNKYCLGRSLSDETKEKIRQARILRKEQ